MREGGEPGAHLGVAGERVTVCVDILVLDWEVVMKGTVATGPWAFGGEFKVTADERCSSSNCSGGESEGGIKKGVASSNKVEEHSYSGATCSSDVPDMEEGGGKLLPWPMSGRGNADAD